MARAIFIAAEAEHRDALPQLLVPGDLLADASSAGLLVALGHHLPGTTAREEQGAREHHVDRRDQDDGQQRVGPQEEEGQDDEPCRRERKDEVKPRAQVEKKRPLDGH